MAMAKITSRGGSEPAIQNNVGLKKRRRTIQDVPITGEASKPSKENIQHFKTIHFFTVFYFLGHLCPPES
jgi:hypothetical protein